MPVFTNKDTTRKRSGVSVENAKFPVSVIIPTKRFSAIVFVIDSAPYNLSIRSATR